MSEIFGTHIREAIDVLRGKKQYHCDSCGQKLPQYRMPGPHDMVPSLGCTCGQNQYCACGCGWGQMSFPCRCQREREGTRGTK